MSSTTKYPTYKDLVEYIPEFMNSEKDIRVFRNYTKEKTRWSVGNSPVQKIFSQDTLLTYDFLNNEISKIREQLNFDQMVKPYPHRDFYYGIIINDLKDLINLTKDWMNRENPKEKTKENTKENSTTYTSISQGGACGKDCACDLSNTRYDDKHLYTEIEIAIAVIEGSKERALRMARESGKSETGDTLEGRVIQGDWQHAMELACQRISSYE